MKRLCVVLCLLGLSTAVFAIDQPATAMAGIQKGEKEISGSFSVMKNSGSDSDMTMWMLVGSAGYFITPKVQLKGSGMVFGNKADDVTMLNGSIGIGADYLFGSNMEYIPYAGGDILVTFSKMDSSFDTGGFGGDDLNSTDAGVGFDVHAGMKQFITDNTAINYEVRYMIDSASDSKWMMFMIGLNVYLQ